MFCYAFINFNGKVSTFGVYLFFIKIISGYAGLRANNLYLRIGGKTFSAPIKQVLSNDRGITIIKHVPISKIALLLEYGSTNGVLPLYLWTFINSFGYLIDNAIKYALKTNFKSNYVLKTDSDEKSLYLKTIITLSLFLVIKLLIISIIKKGKNEKRI